MSGEQLSENKDTTCSELCIPLSKATLNSYLRKGAAGAADLEFEEDDEETAVAAALQDDEEPDAEE